MDIPSFRAVAFSFGVFVSGCGNHARPSPDEIPGTIAAPANTRLNPPNAERNSFIRNDYSELPANQDLLGLVTRLQIENVQLKHQVEKLNTEVKDLHDSLGVSIGINVGLSLLALLMTGITVFLTGRRTAFQSKEAYITEMRNNRFIDLTRWSARYDLWQFQKFGWGDFVAEIREHNLKVLTQRMDHYQNLMRQIQCIDLNSPKSRRDLDLFYRFGFARFADRLKRHCRIS